MPDRPDAPQENREPIVFGSVWKLDTSAAKQAQEELARAARRLNLNTHRSRDGQ
jgi:hypothetical protein